MSKAIVVFDMPKRCSECVLSNPDGDWCPFHGEVNYAEYGSRKPDCCPLKKLPDKISEYKLEEMEPCLAAWHTAKGWNDCLNRILGT